MVEFYLITRKEQCSDKNCPEQAIVQINDLVLCQRHLEELTLKAIRLVKALRVSEELGLLKSEY